ncbi:MAG: zinc ribbon domain-containing protein [Lachnospiraceae bacterium]|nr:zinc ribbon domain-containing protein [Lachnospiraceae bacterium]
MKCWKCGANYSDSAMRCPACGAARNGKEPETNASKPQNRYFGSEEDWQKSRKTLEQKSAKNGKQTVLWAVLGICLVAVAIFLVSKVGKNDKNQNVAMQTTTTAEETTTMDEEEWNAVYQEKLKARFEAMEGHTGELAQDDFLVYFPSTQRYEDAGVIAVLNGGVFLDIETEEEFVLARGAKPGDTTESIRKLYGEPDYTGEMTEDFYLYQWMISNEAWADGAKAALGDTIYDYVFEFEGSDQTKLAVSLDFRFDQDTNELVGYSCYYYQVAE